MHILPADVTAPLQPAAPASPREAAQQFEALLIGQLLRAAREASSSAEDQSGAAILEFAEQQVAELLSRSGGLGLAHLLIEGGLSRSSLNPPESPR